ncbi:subtilisin-like protease SBT3 [Cornus florida]|uniref:subtilisin-like protease SBT3 n=1 Tax=Cornus florida TaxID=4283 RepID=UPI0028981C05|nr:subtilisin-like protease SBT3 [Cornus florida]
MGLVSKVHLLHFIFLAWFLSTSHASSKVVERFTYIVHMDKSYMPKAFASHHHWYTSIVDSTNPVTSNDHQSTPKLIYTYDNGFHGFSGVFSQDEQKTLKKSTGFVSTYSGKIMTLDTIHTFEFLSLNTIIGLWLTSDYCKEVIVGVIDTALWTESWSFNDNGMTKVPKKWKGECQKGQYFNSSLCNSKLIKVKYFNKGVIEANPNITISMNSARDTAGHGTHTSSTTAGNYVEGPSYFCYGSRTTRGVAQRGRVAMYKVIWYEGRYASDILVGMDHAVADGVDVISILIGFDTIPSYEDPIAIASFAAIEKGVLLSSSIRNDGPSFAYLHNGILWVLSVATGSIDRSFGRTVTLGNGLTITRWTMFPTRALVNNLPLIYNKNLSHCNSTTLLFEAPYGILICDDTLSLFTQSTHLTMSTVASAIFISNNLLFARRERFSYPEVVIGSKDAEEVINYAKRAKKTTATMKFQETILGTKPAPIVAPYTLSGPAPCYPRILKPDLMAPGSRVLAAWPPNQYAATIGFNKVLVSDYLFLFGPSMACPHAFGVVALLKETHPEWSQAAIRSAMMTDLMIAHYKKNLRKYSSLFPMIIMEILKKKKNVQIPPKAYHKPIMIELDSCTLNKSKTARENTRKARKTVDEGSS